MQIMYSNLYRFSENKHTKDTTRVVSFFCVIENCASTVVGLKKCRRSTTTFVA